MDKLEAILFDYMVLSSEVGIWKPDPRIFWRAAYLLERQPEECMYVGNSYQM
jgi:FMN phosphatase YigB (HAD superfamily)